MAGPQSLSPQPVFSSRPRRRFSLEQANRSLPLVQRVVTDIVLTREEATRLQSKLEEAAGKEHKRVQEDLDLAIEHLEDFVDELTEIGCELKDYRMGLVDFTGRHLGRDVCLCWKLGEEQIGYWHEQDKGFSGRQPVTTLRETD